MLPRPELARPEDFQDDHEMKGMNFDENVSGVISTVARGEILAEKNRGYATLNIFSTSPVSFTPHRIENNGEIRSEAHYPNTGR